MMQIISTMESQTLSRKVEDLDKYTYRPDRPFRGLQKLCFWFLERIKCYSKHDHVYVESHCIDEQYLLDKIFKQENEIFKQTNFTPSVVYMGRDDYMDMMQSEIPHHYMSFDVNARIIKNGYEKIKGMKLVVVPWMKGVLVVPAEEQKND